MLLFSAFMASDLLLGALHDVRPVETRPGAAQEIFERHFARLQAEAEAAAGHLSTASSLWQYAGGRLFGLRKLLAEATAEFAAVRGRKKLPTVLVVGEIYVRSDPFANGFIIEKLEQRGLRAKLAPLHEWLEYSDLITRREEKKEISLADRLSSHVQHRIQHTLHQCVAGRLGWPEPPSMPATLEAVEPYLRTRLRGEAVLTIGTPLEEWRRGQIDAVVSVGPLECMPNKIAEAQFFHVAEQEGLPTLTLPLNGDPVDDAVLDNFAFTVRARVNRNGATAPSTAEHPRRTLAAFPRNVTQTSPEQAPGH
jgi:predicted nucleotide-binding protein (sugar kinase/HSP70/actin superfamily)